MSKLLKTIFFMIFVKPLVYIILGINVHNRELLPQEGAVIIAANHNSHIDTLVLMSLFPTKTMFSIHPVAAADHFLKNKALSWFAQEIIGILPIERTNSVKASRDFLAKTQKKLDENKILIIYPEGTRGEPEFISEFKNGIAHIAKNNPEIPVIPVCLQGIGKVLPKDESILVPFICDVQVHKPIYGRKNTKEFMQELKSSFKK